MLATLEEYQARYGGEGENAQVSALLADADALVKSLAGQDIEAGTGAVTIESVGRRRLQLPQVPVTAVASVVVDGVTYTTDEYDWDRNGSLWRKNRCQWPYIASVVVTNSHGYAPEDPALVPLVGICCRLVNSYLSDGLGDSNLRSYSENAAGWSESATFGADRASGLRHRLDAIDLGVIETFKMVIGP